MTRALNDVIREIETVQAKIDGLRINAAEAATEAEKLDSVSHDDLIANPASAEQITTKIMAQQRLQQAYETKIAEHETEIQQLRLKAVEVEAGLLEADADRLDKELVKHNKKTDSLLEQLRKHDQSKYLPDDRGALPKSAAMRSKANGLRYSAALNRYFIATGQVTSDVRELRETVESAPQHDGHLLSVTNPMILADKQTKLLQQVRHGQSLELHPETATA